MKSVFIFLTFYCLTLSFSAQNSCQNAFLLPGLGTYEVNTVNGDLPINLATCFNVFADNPNGEWYKFIPTENFILKISTDLQVNLQRDTRVSVYTGSCNNLTCIDFDDDGGSGYTSVLNVEVTSGTEYYILFDNKWENIGFSFELSQGESNNDPIDFNFRPIPFTNSQRNIVVDLNGDYLDDMVYVRSNDLVIYTQNTDGTFSEHTQYLPDVQNSPSWSITAADYDGNGRNDLLYGSGYGATLLTAYTDLSYDVQNFDQYIFCQRSNYVDINNDGDLDIFICNDFEPNVYYLNNGNGGFSFFQGGLGDYPDGGNYGSIWTDYNNDGLIDLFLAKCRGGNFNASLDELWENNGDGTFTNVAADINLEDSIQSWSSAWGDFDNDGDMDVIVGAATFSHGMPKLKINQDGSFVDITQNSGIDGFFIGGREYVTFDFNNDGYLDLFTSGNDTSIFINNGDLTFTPYDNLLANFGAVGDLNNDGFLDIQNSQGIFLTVPNNNHWVKFNTQGTTSNYNGIGARLELYGDWGIQIRDVQAGLGFAETHTLNTHFGIGEATEIDSLIVKWPSGTIDRHIHPAIDQAHLVVEGEETLNIKDVANFTNKMSVMPNPVKDYLKIHSKTEIEKVQIYSLQGQLLTTQKNHLVNMLSYSPGIYLVKIKTIDNQIQTFKILKE